MKDSAAAIFIEFPITLLRLQLSAGDLSSLLCCGSHSGASGMLSLVPGLEVGGSLGVFYTAQGKMQGNNHHIYRWFATLSGAQADAARFKGSQGATGH